MVGLLEGLAVGAMVGDSVGGNIRSLQDTAFANLYSFLLVAGGSFRPETSSSISGSLTKRERSFCSETTRLFPLPRIDRLGLINFVLVLRLTVVVDDDDDDDDDDVRSLSIVALTAVTTMTICSQHKMMKYPLMVVVVCILIIETTMKKFVNVWPTIRPLGKL